jgi:integrase
MKKTRFPGLYRLGDGRYKIRATAVCGRTGKIKEVTKTVGQGASAEEALAILLSMKSSIRRSENDSRPSARRTPSVNDYAEQWLERKAARVRPSVAQNYERALGLFICPILGELQLSRLTRADVERWVTWAERTSKADGSAYAKDTIQGWWRVLSGMLRDAAAEHGLSDPTLRVRPPVPSVRGGRHREQRTLSSAELGLLLDALRALAPDRHAEVYILAYSGLRAGELFALRWEDIDEKMGVIHVRQSVWNGHVEGTKTGDPRDVPLAAPMVAVLREHRRSMVKSQHRGLSSGLVFPAQTGGYRAPQSLHKPLVLACAAAGIEVKVTPQVLRRTFNTLMVYAGVDRIVLRSVMGHCSEQMTERYSGVSVQAKQAALATLLLATEEE